MNKIKIIFAVFIGFVALTFVSSCNKDESKNTSSKQDFKIEVRNLSLSNLSVELENYWHYAFSNYTMDVVCSCSCPDISRMPDIWENGRHLLPNIVKTASMRFTNCDSLKAIYKQECLFNTFTEAHSSIQAFMNSRTYLSGEEKNLMTTFIKQVKTNTLDREFIKTIWNNLPNNELLNNDISLAFIQIGFSIIDFHTKNPGTFGPIDQEPQAIFNHIMGALAGGVLSVMADCVEDVYYNTGYGDKNVWGDFKRSFVKGAITGAIGSV